MNQRTFDVDKNLKAQLLPLVHEYGPDFIFISTKDKDTVTVSGKYRLPNVTVPLLAAKRNVDDGHFVMLRKSEQVWQSRDIAKNGWQDRVISIETEVFGARPEVMIGEAQTMRELHNSWHTRDIVMLASKELKKGEVYFCMSM